MSTAREDELMSEIYALVEHFMKTPYRAKENDAKNEHIINNCLKLFGKDYKYTVVQNTAGDLCSHYPSKIVALEYAITGGESSKECVESMYDATQLKDLFTKARFARCRARFAVPVILFEGKHICRSATISGGAEIYGRSGFDFFMTGGGSIPGGQGGPSQSTSQSSSLASSGQFSSTSSSTSSQYGNGNGGGGSNEWQLFDRIRGQDIRLLKTFSIGYICDLMVEKKKVKFGMNVTSSEKVDKENRYADFRILAVPYPGCEFFKEWKDSGYRSETMTFDWSQGYVDAHLDLPRHPSPPRQIDWLRYRQWNLIKLTQNYLKLLLHYVKEGDCGLLIHCISGWDRTPLFISLLRLTLWADGVIHSSLSPSEILYLTIAYDWFLFGHNLPDRAVKGEEIFFFCFHFLKYITSEDFNSSKGRRSKRTATTRNDSECNIDGVLLDPELSRASYRGSNTSLSSSSSVNSTKSSVDNAPIYFSAGSLEDESPSVMVSNNNPPRISPVSRIQADHPFRGNASTNSTSPVAVPSAIRRNLSELRNSPNCGSWQIVSGSGIFTGSTSSYGSVSSQSEQPNGQCAHSHDANEPVESTRKLKLDAVRQNFLTIYTSLLGSQPNLEAAGGSGSGGISGLLGNFAEKVGFRSSRNSFV